MIFWSWVGCGDPVGLRGKVDPDDTVPEVVSSTACGACGGDCLLEELAYPQRYHVEGGVAYGDVPPAGGPHDPCWAPFGVHEDAVPDERWVHNLEHGAIVVLHGPDEDPAGPRAWSAGREWSLVTPYADLGSPYAALAWGFRLTLGCWDEGEVDAFADDHEDDAPESVLSGPGASCM
jgi:hypothetical protein